MSLDIDYKAAFNVERAKRLAMENDIKALANKVMPILKSVRGQVGAKPTMLSLLPVLANKDNQAKLMQLVELAPLLEKYESLLNES